MHTRLATSDVWPHLEPQTTPALITFFFTKCLLLNIYETMQEQPLPSSLSARAYLLPGV